MDEKDYFESNSAFVAKDEAMRDENSHELRVVILGGAPDLRYLSGFRDVSNETRSDVVLHASYLEDGREIDWGSDHRSARRVLYYPSEAERLTASNDGDDRLQSLARSIDAGSVVSMLGRDVSRSWKDSSDHWRTTVEFHAMRIGLGEQTREQLMAVEPGGLADLSIRRAAAIERSERDAVDAEYLARPGSMANVAKRLNTMERSVERTATGAKGPASGRSDADDAMVVASSTSRSLSR